MFFLEGLSSINNRRLGKNLYQHVVKIYYYQKKVNSSRFVFYRGKSIN